MNASSLRKRALNVADLRDMARRRLPKLAFEFLDRGTEDDLAVRRNREALDRLLFMPRVLLDVSRIDTTTPLLGVPAALPVGISATGATFMLQRDADLHLARAAKAAGVPFMVAETTTAREKLAEVGARLWYQHYLLRDVEQSCALFDRARDLGYEALVLTVDTAADPNREYNRRNGFVLPVRPSLRVMMDAATRPGWSLGVLAPGWLGGQLKFGTNRPPLGRGAFTWETLAVLRRRWRGPMFLKGVLNPADARRAVEAGCEGVIVSNHGGRNLDHSIPAIDALPGVVEAVGDRGQVLYDSGIRRGSDVVKALALGARFVFVGRATLYGVSAAGEAGAARALEILDDELRRVMAFCGCASIAEITPDLIAGAAAAGGARRGSPRRMKSSSSPWIP